MDLKSESVPGLSKKYVIVVGAGLAGAEAAWQAANNGAWVKLYEMRPKKRHQPTTPEILLNWSAAIPFAPLPLITLLAY